jgi:hypothetical protein
MRSLPLPLRVAAGLAAITIEQARTLPAKLAGLPVTVASHALQLSMRVQQQITELAIKGDEVLAVLRPVEEIPEWATFDEDIDQDTNPRSGPDRPAPVDDVAKDAEPLETDELGLAISASANGHVVLPDPWALEERSLASASEESEEFAANADQTGPAGSLPAVLANYDALSLPQLRAQLRMFSAEDLQVLLDHERTHRNRPSFVGMLTRRIAALYDQR